MARIPIFELLLVATAAVVVIALLPRGSHPRTGHVLRASWSLTPGVVNPAVTPATLRGTVCRKGWTATVRPPTSYTNALKLRQMRARGLRGPPSAYQEDHLISLELGGNPTDPRNLWPEPYPRAADVDKIENELNDRLCSGAITLDQAQRTESALKHRDG
ncbi:MAG TPA: hypothetical protein VH538_10055 [Gaiellaceae bacterium]|jgi:hypothetical protein